MKQWDQRGTRNYVAWVRLAGRIGKLTNNPAKKFINLLVNTNQPL